MGGGVFGGSGAAFPLLFGVGRLRRVRRRTRFLRSRKRWCSFGGAWSGVASMRARDWHDDRDDLFDEIQTVISISLLGPGLFRYRPTPNATTRLGGLLRSPRGLPRGGGGTPLERATLVQLASAPVDVERHLPSHGVHCRAARAAYDGKTAMDRLSPETWPHGCVPLCPGDILVMTGSFQQHMQHATSRHRDMVLDCTMVTTPRGKFRGIPESMQSEFMARVQHMSEQMPPPPRDVLTWRRIARHQRPMLRRFVRAGSLSFA